MSSPTYLPRRIGGPSAFTAATALLAVLLILGPDPVRATAKATSAKVTIAKATAKGTKVTIAGKVTLPASWKNTPKSRSKVIVALTLASAAGKRETFSAKITRKRTFAVAHTTKLAGALGLAVQVKIGGKPSGKKLTKAVKVTPSAAKPTRTSPTATKPASTAPSAAGPTVTSPTPTGPTNPPPPGANKLLGLFRLEPGAQSIAGAITGSNFVMTYEGSNLVNGDSPFYTQTVTPLRPGSDGGLSTVKYQPAPTPGFAGGDTGGSLASSITLPQKFFNIDFGITTDPVDRQTGLPAPLPEIYEKDGKLFGQTSAWDAQWNGSSFNQGAPKPDGTYQANPGTTGSFGVGGTVAVFGTYDSATRHFTLRWQSLIVGGAFSGYSGQWNLAGTYEPAA